MGLNDFDAWEWDIWSFCRFEFPAENREVQTILESGQILDCGVKNTTHVMCFIRSVEIAIEFDKLRDSQEV